MRFSTEDELNPIGSNRTKPLQVTEDQVGTFVGCKAARKSDGESLLVQFYTGGCLNQLAQNAPARSASIQQRMVGKTSCIAELTRVFFPAGEMAIEQSTHLRGCPRDVMNAVGDRCDVCATKHR